MGEPRAIFEMQNQKYNVDSFEKEKSLDYHTHFPIIRKLNQLAIMNESALQTLKDGLKRKPHVNSTCIGCSACTAISGSVFELDENGLSCVMPLASYEGQDVDDSIAACPVNAISWQEVDQNGNYLN